MTDPRSLVERLRQPHRHTTNAHDGTALNPPGSTHTAKCRGGCLYPEAAARLALAERLLDEWMKRGDPCATHEYPDPLDCVYERTAAYRKGEPPA